MLLLTNLTKNYYIVNSGLSVKLITDEWRKKPYHNAVLPQFLTWDFPRWVVMPRLKVSEYKLSLLPPDAIASLSVQIIDQKTLLAVTNAVVKD